MKRILVATAFCLLLPGLAFAQQEQHGQEHQGGRPAAAPPSRPGPGPAAPQRPGPPGPQRPGPVGPPHVVQGPPPGGRPQEGYRPPAGRPPQGFAGRPQQGYRPPMVAQPLPPRGNQFWHRGNYFARIHGPAYRYPPGWGYRRWGIGARLPALFLAPAFFYAGWAALNLEPPPPGYAWVRYGPDLLEVNLATGEIDDVVYGVFY